MSRASGALLAGAIATCAALVATALAGNDTTWELLLPPVLAFLAGRAGSRAAGALAAGLIGAGIAASQLIAYDDGSVVPEIMLPATFYVAGLALRSRESLAARLAERAHELEDERDAYARLSVRYERARIAAELHDIVAHAVSMMVVQASAGQRLLTRGSDGTAETFDVIATAARQAQADLDRLAVLLAHEAAAPQADLALLREIVDTARASGLPVTLRVSGDPTGVSDAAAHAAVRVVQEGLTNALRYAPGAAVEVVVDARPGAAIDLSVVNAPPVAPPRLELGSGRGLTGLRERVHASGGTFAAGPSADGGWALHASIAG